MDAEEEAAQMDAEEEAAQTTICRVNPFIGPSRRIQDYILEKCRLGANYPKLAELSSEPRMQIRLPMPYRVPGDVSCCCSYARDWFGWTSLDHFGPSGAACGAF